MMIIAIKLLKGRERITEMEAQVQSESVIVFPWELLRLMPFHFVIDILALDFEVFVESRFGFEFSRHRSPS